jgi:hypothetical protein
MISSLFLVLVFMSVIPKIPASKKYIEENGSEIVIAILNSTKYLSLISIQNLFRDIYLNLDCKPV